MITGIVTLLLTFLLMVRNPLTQTILARIATEYLSNRLNTEIKIKRLDISGLRTIKVSNLLIKDQAFDTLIYARSIEVGFELNLRRIDIKHLNKLYLQNADVRIKKIKDSPNSNLQFILDYFSRPEKASDTLKKDRKKLEIALQDIQISNTAFRFENPNQEKEDSRVDFSDISITNLQVNARNLTFSQDTFHVRVDHIELYEKSGFLVDSLSCDFTLSPVLLQANNLLVRTPLNDLDLDFRFSYDTMKDFKDFINKIQITTEIRPSIVNLSEVGYFAPVMFNMYNRLRLSALIRGTVNNFKAWELKVGIGKMTQFRGEVQMNGLPDITETFSHVTVDRFITSMEDVSAFRLPTDKMFIALPESMQKFGTVSVEGKFTGFYNDFVSYAGFRTGLGDFDTDILVRVNKNNNITYKGHLSANDFHAGRFFNAENVMQRLDLVADITGSGTSFETMQVDMVGSVDSLEFFDNLYNKIRIQGGIDNKKFTGEFAVEDDKGSLDFNGSIDYSQPIPAYNFTARLRDAYLHKINLVNRDTSSRLSSQMNINFMGDDIDNIQGIIIIDSTEYTELGKTYTLNDFTLSITRESNQYAFLRCYSDILDATMEGQYDLDLLPASLYHLVNQYLDTLVYDSSFADHTFSGQDFIFSLVLKNPQPLTELFVPDLQLEPNTRFSGGFNERIGNLFFDGRCPSFTYKGAEFQRWYTDFFIQDNSLQFVTGAKQVWYSDTLRSDSMRIQLIAQNDSIIYQINWDDFSNVSFSKADLGGHVVMLGQNRLSVGFDRSEFQFSDTLWTFYPTSRILVDSSSIFFDRTGLHSQNQDIYLNGTISMNPADTLLVAFDNFDLSSFDVILQTLDVDLDGFLDGNIKMMDFYGSPFYLSNIHIRDLAFNKEKLGAASLRTIWDSKINAFDIAASIIYIGNIGRDTTLLVQGKYFPDRQDQNFNFEANFSKYKLTTLLPFTKSFSSDISGMASGKLLLKGTRTKPELTGEIDLVRTSLLIDYLNVKYYLADKILFDKDRIFFDNIVLNDSLNNQAIASGSIYHDHLSGFHLDVNINTQNLATMNTGRSQNEMIYGHVMASGDFRIHGPFQNITMDVNASSEKGTSIKIPVSYGTDVGSSEYIVFVGNEEETDQDSQQYDVEVGGSTVNLDLDITNDADIQLFMPYNMGNLRTRGKGGIQMNILPSGNLNMEGEYIIGRGTFFFTLSSIISRTFEISRGSKVVFTGDPYDAKINVKAVYKVKTTLGEYGPPEDSASRVPVNCIITLTNNLVNPVINFGVEFPDLQDDIKQTIYARLDTTDQAEMSRQMISLLVLNSFYQPSGYSGSVGFNTVGLVTNQLNNWLSQISSDFDIGVNYRPGDEISAQEVEVALSTQLFDERVLIDGNVGMRGNENTAQTTNTIVGEVTVEVKITEDGRFRAKAFNRSNNNYLYRNYAPYTQGVGVFYTQEFHKLSEVFRFGKKEDETTAPPVESKPQNRKDTVKK